MLVVEGASIMEWVVLASIVITLSTLVEARLLGSRTEAVIGFVLAFPLIGTLVFEAAAFLVAGHFVNVSPCWLYRFMEAKPIIDLRLMFEFQATACQLETGLKGLDLVASKLLGWHLLLWEIAVVVGLAFMLGEVVKAKALRAGRTP